MITSTEMQMDTLYLSYSKILYRFKILNIKTRTGKEITSIDLRRAIEIMIRKHPSCRWKRITKKRNEYNILIEEFIGCNLCIFKIKKSKLMQILNSF